MVPVLKFNGYGDFSGLMYHSPHSVVYEEELYPTALHLFEARKFPIIDLTLQVGSGNANASRMSLLSAQNWQSLRGGIGEMSRSAR